MKRLGVCFRHPVLDDGMARCDGLQHWLIDKLGVHNPVLRLDERIRPAGRLRR